MGSGEDCTLRVERSTGYGYGRGAAKRAPIFTTFDIHYFKHWSQYYIQPPPSSGVGSYVCMCVYVCASVPFERNSTFPSLDNKVVHGDGIWLGSLPGWYHYCVSCSPTSLIFNACVYFLVSFRCFAPDQSPPLAHTAQHYSFERQVSFLRSFHIQFGKAAQAVMGDGSDLIWQRRARVRMNCFAQPGTRGAKRLN